MFPHKRGARCIKERLRNVEGGSRQTLEWAGLGLNPGSPAYSMCD